MTNITYGFVQGKIYYAAASQEKAPRSSGKMR